VGKSANKKKAALPIRTIVPKAKLKTKVKPSANGKTKPAKTKRSDALPAPAADAVLDRLYAIVDSRRYANPAVSHSARLMSRGIAKVAQKFGEEAVECLIEAVAGNRDALVAESADVLYHLMVLWVASGVRPEQVWAELERREGVSGLVERASRNDRLPLALRPNTSKIP
jgi:phosphoribosyl-ATP pyrophosphohydrolase